MSFINRIQRWHLDVECMFKQLSFQKSFKTVYRSAFTHIEWKIVPQFWRSNAEVTIAAVAKTCTACHASVVATFETVAGSCGSGSAVIVQQSAESWIEP